MSYPIFQVGEYYTLKEIIKMCKDEGKDIEEYTDGVFEYRGIRVQG